MSNSPLVNHVRLSPNYSLRRSKIDRITIHHMGSTSLSIEACGAGFADRARKASSHYGVGTDGRIGLYVEEKHRSWCTSSLENDDRAITIEVANDSRWPDWHVSDKALEATIELCVDICKRNGIERLNYTGDKTGNLTMHKWYQETICPGPYLGSKFPYIAAEVNKRLGIVEDVVIVPENKDPEPSLSIGDEVKLANGARYTNGGAIAPFVFDKILYVRGINGDDITISILKTGAITGTVNRRYLLSLDNSVVDDKNNDVNFNDDLKVGDEVKLVSAATYYNGKQVPSWLFNKKLYVRKLQGEMVTVSIFKVGAVTGTINKNHLVKY